MRPIEVDDYDNGADKDDDEIRYDLLLGNYAKARCHIFGKGKLHLPQN